MDFAWVRFVLQGMRCIILHWRNVILALQLGKLYNRVKKKCNDDEITLIAGEGGLDNIVRWMHIVEGVEISHFLEGNEVAFTTGIALKSEDDLLELVKDAYERGASGMVINTGPYISNVPKEVIDFCEEKSMPLFEMPWQAHMAHVMKFFAEEITFSDRRNMELVSAVKNAIFFSGNYDLYFPALERYGYRSEWSYCVAICECVGIDSELDEKVIEGIKIFIENSISVAVHNLVVFTMDNQIVLFFGNIGESEIERLLRNAIADMPEKFTSKANIYAGVGRNTRSMRCIFKTFNIASKVVTLQKRRMANNQVISYHGLGISKLFLTMDDYDLMREFFLETLEPLVKYDQINGTDYLGFLKLYFDNGGSVRETAEDMYLHRNSINYKIKRVEEILDCDFANMTEKAKILVALNIKEFL